MLFTTDKKTTRTVLIVDDDANVCAALRRTLQHAKYIVHVASDGQAGLEVLKRQPIQLVVSDKDMPGMTGIEFLGIVRDRHPRVCRVLLTGNPELQGALDAINQGEVFRFLEKPWNTEQLLSTIHFAFEAIELQEENRLLTERTERLLLNVLPRAVVTRLKRGETVIADRIQEATILFADLVGFTKFSAQLTPEQLVRVLNDVFSAFDQLAEELGVEKIKTLGDGYLAAAGVPTPRPDHAKAIVELALRMPQALAQVSDAHGRQIEMRIGIHTGPLVAGVLGLNKFSYDLWGDTVNIASRMESHGVPGKIHATYVLEELLHEDYIFEPRGLIDVKGKGPMQTYFLLGPKR